MSSGPPPTTVDAVYLRRCLRTLERALAKLERSNLDEVDYDIFRAAWVKEFEIVLEQSGKLLRKRLAAYFASNREADRLVFKDVFRHPAKHGLIDPAACERWMEYRDNRNETAPDYGEVFADATLNLLPDFIADARDLASVIEEADRG